MSTGSLELFSIRGSLESSLHIGGSTVLEPLPQQLPTPTDPGRAIAHEPIPELNQLGQSARPPSVTSIFESRLSADPDDIADQIRTILGTRLERGKGNHTCPYGVQCTKGGVVDGKTVVFERNSTFRLVLLHSFMLHKPSPSASHHLLSLTATLGTQWAISMHLQRHQKTFMCTVPGCSNRDGFARQDQLLRHQRTIHQRSAPAEGPAQLWKDDGMMLA